MLGVVIKNKKVATFFFIIQYTEKNKDQMKNMDHTTLHLKNKDQMDQMKNLNCNQIKIFGLDGLDEEFGL